ncbi:MAG: ABC transporter substrate-binding protein [Candidatus Thorarchaeota archaeon]
MGKKQFSLMVLIISFLMLSMTVNLKYGRAVELVPNPDTLVVVKYSYPYTFEPIFAWDSASIEPLVNCYDTLIAYDREKVDSFVPNIATFVPTLENGGISPDGLTYRFHIRSGVTFQNGLPLTPEDIEYTFERAMVRDPDWGPVFLLIEPLLGVPSTRDGNGGFAVAFEDIDNAVEVDGDDVVFHLIKPHAPFMHLLVSWFSSVVSKQWCIANGDWPGTAETWEAYNNLIGSPLQVITMGTGPFWLESLTPEEVVLARNDLYWLGPAKLSKVIFKIISDPETTVQMLIEGDVDFCPVPSYKYAELEGIEGIRVFKELRSMVVYYLAFNYVIQDFSPHIGTGLLDGYGIPPDFFNDVDIRKAFAYAFDYDTIINDWYLGEALQPASVIVEGLPFHNPDQPKYSFNLAQAEEHFMQAWGGQVWEKGFKFDITYWEYSEFWRAQAEMLEANIEALNPKFNIELVGVPFFALFSGELPTFFIGWGADFADPHSLVFPLLHSSQIDAQLTGYSDPLVDELILEGVSTLDPAQRQAIYYELQSIYHDEVISLPFAQPLSRHYERDWVQGWYYNLGAPTDYYSLWKEEDNLVNVLIKYVEDIVNNEVLSQGEGNSLIKKLESAIRLMDKGNLQGASQKLNDFINQVEALTMSGRLPMEIGQEFIALAYEIIESFGVI